MILTGYQNHWFPIMGSPRIQTTCSIQFFFLSTTTGNFWLFPLKKTGSTRSRSGGHRQLLCHLQDYPDDPCPKTETRLSALFDGNPKKSMTKAPITTWSWIQHFFVVVVLILNVDSSAQLARGFASTFWTTLSGKNGAKKTHPLSFRVPWAKLDIRSKHRRKNVFFFFFFFQMTKQLKKTPSTKNGLKLFFLVNFPTLLVQMVFQRNPRLKCIGWLGLWIRCCFHRREQKISHLFGLLWRIFDVLESHDSHYPSGKTNMVRGKISWICRMYLLYVSVMYYTSTVYYWKKWRDFHCYVCLPEGKHATFCSHGIRLCKCNVMKKKKKEEEEEEEEKKKKKKKEEEERRRRRRRKKKKKQTGWRQKRQSLTQKKANSLHSFSRINAECTLG